MLHNFGLYKRPLLTVLAVLLTTAFTTASAAMIDLSQHQIQRNLWFLALYKVTQVMRLLH